MHVAVQVGGDPLGLVAGDATAAEWQIEVRPSSMATGRSIFVDRRSMASGPTGSSTSRGVTWATTARSDVPRAKLMVADIPAELLARAAGDEGELVAELGLSDDQGCPRCARVRPPAIRWSLAAVTG